MDLREASTGQRFRHPWETIRRDFVCRELRSALEGRAGFRVLDVGSGDAWLASEFLRCFPNAGEISCWDRSYTPEQLASLARGEPRLKLSSGRPEGRFEVSLLLDVLEHIDDDRAFLRDLVETSLADGGLAMITLPAWPALYGPHDTFLRHYRRYSPASATELAESSGLTILRSGMIFPSLLLVRLLSRFREKLMPDERPQSGGEWRHGLLATRAVEMPLRIEALVVRALTRAYLAPPGLSWWALCRRR